MMHVSIVPPEHIWRMWEDVKPYVERAAEYTFGRYTVNDIYEAVTDRNYIFWIAFDETGIKGIVVTDFVDYPRKRCLVMHFCAGDDLADWKQPMLSTLQNWARDTGCEAIESSGRPGWARIFKADGYKPLWQTYELPVDTGAGDDNG